MDKVLQDILQVLLDNKAEDIVYLDVTKINPLAQYYVICTATSSRHALALAKYIDTCIYKNELSVRHIEGNENSEWILVDANDYIIHIFVGDARIKYGLEKMWSNLDIYRVG